MDNRIESPKDLLDKIRFDHEMSMQEIADRTKISLATLYRIYHGAACKWSIQEKLWALLAFLNNR